MMVVGTDGYVRECDQARPLRRGAFKLRPNAEMDQPCKGSGKRMPGRGVCTEARSRWSTWHVWVRKGRPVRLEQWVKGLLREKRLKRAGVQTPGPHTLEWGVWDLFSAHHKSDCVTQLSSVSWIQSNFPAWTTRPSMAWPLPTLFFTPVSQHPEHCVSTCCSLPTPQHVHMQLTALERNHISELTPLQSPQLRMLYYFFTWPSSTHHSRPTQILMFL